MISFSYILGTKLVNLGLSNKARVLSYTANSSSTAAWALLDFQVCYVMHPSLSVFSTQGLAN